MTLLKLENETILKFDFSKNIYEILHPELLPFSLRERLVDTTKITDVSALYSTGFNNKDAIARFFRNRSLSVVRENAKYILNQLGIKQNNDFDTHYKTMILCKALSVTDNYWITNNEKERWEDVNLQNNPLHKVLQQIALFGRSLTITGPLHSPELTGQGAYAKAWYREDGKLFLFKANSIGGNESEREVVASNILDCFNVPHVKYELTTKDGKVVCKCENMNFDNTSLVDLVSFDDWVQKKGLNLYETARKIDPEMYFKTIVVDYLIANRDRHLGNWGFYMNNETGEVACMHPLFDHNNAFDNAFMDDPTGGICQLTENKNQKEAALYAIKNCDFRCVKPVTKNMFLNEKMYKTFMNRACELGLYKRQKISIFDKIFSSSKQEYIPVEIKENNVNLYWKKAKELLKKQDTKNINTSINNIVTKTQTIANTRINTKRHREKKDEHYDYERS